MKYLFVISTVLSLLFFLLLVSKKQKKKEHWFLAGIFLFLTINSIYIFFIADNSNGFYLPVFSELNYALPMLYAPLLWFYTRSLVEADFVFSKKQWFHFFPFLILLLVLLLPLVSNIQLPESELIGYPLPKLIVTPLYLVPVLILLKKYRKKLLNHVSNTDKINMIWLDWITVGALSFWLIATIGYLINIFSEDSNLFITDFYILALLAFYLFALAYIAFTQTDLFHNQLSTYQPTESKGEVEPKNIETLNDDLEKLTSLMEQEKYFLDPQLTLYKLSELSGIPQYKISKALNTIHKQNFFEFINTYRVEHVKQMLADGQATKMNLLGIAMDSGFNSKASFNRIFKNITGMTPSGWMKKGK